MQHYKYNIFNSFACSKRNSVDNSASSLPWRVSVHFTLHETCKVWSECQAKFFFPDGILNSVIPVLLLKISGKYVCLSFWDTSNSNSNKRAVLNNLFYQNGIQYWTVHISCGTHSVTPVSCSIRYKWTMKPDANFKYFLDNMFPSFSFFVTYKRIL